MRFALAKTPCWIAILQTPELLVKFWASSSLSKKSSRNPRTNNHELGVPFHPPSRMPERWPHRDCGVVRVLPPLFHFDLTYSTPTFLRTLTQSKIPSLLPQQNR